MIISPGYLAEVKGDFAAAAAEFREVMRINPDEPDARSNLGFILYKGGKTAEALAECREAARLRPDHAEARLKYGGMLANVDQDYEAALVEVRAAVRLRPDGTAPSEPRADPLPPEEVRRGDRRLPRGDPAGAGRRRRP